MKFLLFNAAVIAALVYLFGVDRSDLDAASDHLAAQRRAHHGLDPVAVGGDFDDQDQGHQGNDQHQDQACRPHQ